MGMSSPTDPKTVRLVLPPSTAQPTHSITSKNDMIMLKTGLMDDLSLMGWTPDNDDPPNDKENSPEVRKPSISISYAKIQQFIKDLTDNSPTTHTVNTDNSDNNVMITPSPSTSHETNTNTDLVMTDCPDGWDFYDNLIHNDAH